jgi:two-component system, NtrC family, sensor kinase
MMGVIEKIPTCLMVCVLVMVFACLKRHTRSARLTLWAVGWTLVSVHFLAQLLAPVDHYAVSCLRAIDAGALQLAAITFLLSVSVVAEDRPRRTVLLLTLAIPSVSYAVLNACGLPGRWLYAVCLIVCFAGSACFFFWRERRFSPLFFAVALLASLAGAWALRAALRGSFEEGTVVLLGLGFILAAVFICRNYWAPSPAVLTIAIGFFLWGAAFPVLYLATRFARMTLPAGLGDVPKLFVAFGMILAVVEDKSNALTGMQHQAAALHRQLESFSVISFRLLTTTAPDSILNDIASTITDVTSFRAVLIHIETPEKTLRLAASSGVSAGFVNVLEQRPQDWMAAQIPVRCLSSRPISPTSFLLPAGEGFFALEGSPCPQGSELLIPLRSAAGTCLGSITLLSAGVETSIPVQELARIESLAIDLSVAIELKSLYTQLVCSEKLAAMGQLVAGVAHELNNPLTAIMGFGELISDATTSARTSDQLARLLSETRRMKRLTDNLLRFSRHSSADATSSQFAPVVHEVLALCEYRTRKSHLTVETEIAPDLPSLAINEDEIKQVLLNLFNNSCDALNDSSGAKQIKIRAHRSHSRAVIQVEDTGPGFSNLNRALDPFYTTKPEGKGTGLGLSICYGIAKRRGGDLRIENVKPQGARVTLEVPVSEAHSNPLFAASARA